jgi:predicted RNA binding protein YcfA (HicA-like mRNA interferase family)
VRLPRDLSGNDVVKALRRLGFEFSRQTGSHAIMRKGPRTVVVPQHKAIKPGTLKGVLEQAGVSPEELQQNLYLNRRQIRERAINRHGLSLLTLQPRLDI